MKACLKCFEPLIANENWPDYLRRNKSNICQPCKQVQQKEWYQKNKSERAEAMKKWRVKNKKEISDRHQEYRATPEGRAACLVTSAKSRSLKKGLPFDLDVQWIAEKIKNGKCEVTGLDFTLDKSKGAFAPSLDQIIPGKGYTKDNVQVVVFIYNTCKGGFDAKDIDLFVRTFADRLR